MRLKLIFIAGAIIAIAIFVAGCGGGGDSTAEDTMTGGGGSAATANSKAGGESKPLTQAEFETRINEICIEVPPTYEEELKKLEKGGKKLSIAESNLKAAVPPLHSAVEQMEAVTPPPGEEPNLEELIAALESAAKGVEENPTTELSGPQSPFAEFQALSKKFGFESCSGL